MAEEEILNFDDFKHIQWRHIGEIKEDQLEASKFKKKL